MDTSKLAEITGREKRIYVRAPLKRKVLLLHSGNLYSAFSLDVSVQGMRVELANVLPRGDTVKIMFPLNDSIMRVMAEVVYTAINDGIANGIPNVGLKFTALDFDSRSSIEQFVNSYQNSLEELHVILKSKKLSADRIEMLSKNLQFSGSLEELRDKVEQELLYFARKK